MMYTVLKAMLILIIISGSLSFGQDYRIVKKQYAHATKKPKYEFSITYPEIKGFTNNVTGMEMFNKHINNVVLAKSDTFSTWMYDWDTTTTNHEFGSYYEAGDTVYYASNELISIQFYEGYYFSGAAHPNNSSFAVNYDLGKYRAIGLGDVLTGSWLDTISAICIRELRKQKRSEVEVLDDWIQSGAGPDAKNYTVWNVTKAGLLITFVTYQVGSYAEGPSEVLIPYGDIKDLIRSNGLLAGFVR
jgi:hypothetical protein